LDSEVTEMGCLLAAIGRRTPPDGRRLIRIYKRLRAVSSAKQNKVELTSGGYQEGIETVGGSLSDATGISKADLDIT